MEFEKALALAAEVLVFCGGDAISPEAPQGLWFCDNVIEVSDIRNNAVCLGSGVEWDAVVKCRPFFELFPYVVIVTPNAIARERLVKELFPRISTSVVYVIQDAGFRGCKTIGEYINAYEKIAPNLRIDVFDAAVFACCAYLEDLEAVQKEQKWLEGGTANG